MASHSSSETGSNHVVGWAAGRAAKLVVLGFTLVVSGLALYPHVLGLVLLGMGAAFAMIGLVARVLRLGVPKADVQAVNSLEQFVAKDGTPCFITDDDGEIILQNGAARSGYSTETGDALGRVLRGLFANPSALISRLEARARIKGTAREDVVTRRGHLRIMVHTVSEDHLLWRLEELGERASSGRGADSLSLPMMTTSGSGTILFMNDALKRLLGGRVRRVEEVFATPPALDGGPCALRAEKGLVHCQAVEIPGPAGRKEVFLLPLNDQATQSETGQIARLDDLPVALLRISDTGTVESANRLARELLGEDTKPGATMADLVEGLGRSVRDWLDEAQQGRGLNRTEVVRARKIDNKDTFLQITLTRTKTETGTGLTAVLNDATELKTLEAQFVQSQKMQAIGQLAGGVAHDFNNLLTAISGHCDLLLLRHDQGDPDYGDLIQINQNANRAAALVGQLLAFSRKQNLQPEVLDLPETLADLTHLLNRLVGEPIRLSFVHDPGLLPIRADKRQFEQVMMNLVVNARDAMPNGGEITIETEVRSFQKEFRRDRAVVPPGQYVIVKVTDQGVGIHPEQLSKIFEPFYTTKRTGEGTGLGLSTAYGIIKQTGGYIFVDSVLGSGSSFTLLFPAYDRITNDTAEPVLSLPTPAANTGEGVILLVEDEAPVRAFASRALRMRGYTVLEAENAEDALKTLEDNDLKVDVFVTDVIMPGMDGPSWVRKALESRPDVKVVFVSGYAEDSFAENQALIPNSVFLPKPFSLNELTATVNAQIH